MQMVCSLFYRIDLLPHFLSYYRRRGVTQFLCSVWHGTDNPHWRELRRMEGGDIVLLKAEGEMSGESDTAVAQRVIDERAAPGAWVMVADLDEFHWMKRLADFRQVAAEAEKEGASYVRSRFIDRVTEAGEIPAVLEQNVWKQFPRNAWLTRDFVRGNCRKVMMLRRGVRLTSGHHGADGVPYRRWGLTFHFKWWGRARLQAEQVRRSRVYREHQWRCWRESDDLGDWLLHHDRLGVGRRIRV